MAGNAVRNEIEEIQFGGYSMFEKDVIAYVESRVDQVEVVDIPKEAFSNPNVLVNSLTDDTSLSTVFKVNHWASPEEAIRYLDDNSDEICAVLDSTGRMGEALQKMEGYPEQVVLDVYAEEAKDLLAKTPFYFNQSVRQEESDNSLNAADLKAICADLKREPYIRNEDVVEFKGIENGKPFTDTFEQHNMTVFTRQFFDDEQERNVKVGLYPLIDKAARDFRVQGPKETLKDFELQVKAFAKNMEQGRDPNGYYSGKGAKFAEDVRDWYKKAVSQFITSTRDKGLDKENEKSKSNLKVKVLEQDKDLSRSM